MAASCDEVGATTVEYSILAAAIAAIVVPVVVVVGGQTCETIEETSTNMAAHLDVPPGAACS